VVCPTTHTYRYWVAANADKATSRAIVEASIPPEGTLFFTNEANNYTGPHQRHGTVCHSKHEWARDDDEDGVREVHCLPGKGALKAGCH
jgi:hypothetical protein